MLYILFKLFFAFGLYLIAIVLAIKFIILLIYKPKDYKYAVNYLFIYHHKYIVRREEYNRWRHYQTILNSITVCLHLCILLFFIAQTLHFLKFDFEELR